MGWIEKRSGGYRAMFPDPARRKHSRTFTRKVDAERSLRQSEPHADRGTFVPAKAGAWLTFGDDVALAPVGGEAAPALVLG
jgi:hypothetical protein